MPWAALNGNRPVSQSQNHMALISPRSQSTPKLALKCSITNTALCRWPAAAPHRGQFLGAEAAKRFPWTGPPGYVNINHRELVITRQGQGHSHDETSACAVPQLRGALRVLPLQRWSAAGLLSVR